MELGSAMAKDLLAIMTASGPIYFGYGRAEAIPTALCFMAIRELAHKAHDPTFPARTVIGTEVAGDEAAQRSRDYAATAMGTFATLGPYGQGRFIAELLRYIGHHGDATGLEGILVTAMQSAWPHLTAAWAVTLVDVWHRFAMRSKYADRYPVIAYDERARRVRVFAAGELGTLRPETALPRKFAEAAEGAFVGAGRPDYQGPAPAGAWAPKDRSDADHYFDGLNERGFDWRAPGGWDGRSGGWGDMGSGVGFGPERSSGRDWRTGSPQPGDRPGGGGIPGVSDLGTGRGLFDRGNPFKDQGALAGLYGPGKALREGGPFSEAFIGRPGPYGPEVFNPWTKEGEAKGRSEIASSDMSLGNLMMLAAIPAAGVAAGLVVTNPIGAGFIGGVGLGLLVGGYLVRADADKAKLRAERDLADAKYQQELEKEASAAAQKEKERQDQEKKDADKKALEEQKKKEENEKEKKPNPKKTEAGLYPDPYGDGGGGVNWSGLSRLPVGDEEGGVGPLWLEALPSEDGEGIGPNRGFLPTDDSGSGTPRPNSVVPFASIAVAGPGLASLVMVTGASTTMILGMPKMRSDGTIRDPGLLVGVI
jgi:hypothetical protein